MALEKVVNINEVDEDLVLKLIKQMQAIDKVTYVILLAYFDWPFEIEEAELLYLVGSLSHERNIEMMSSFYCEYELTYIGAIKLGGECVGGMHVYEGEEDKQKTKEEIKKALLQFKQQNEDKVAKKADLIF